jgi:hypothetical protein
VVEVADRRLGNAEHVGADPRRFLAFLDRELAAKLADELHAVGRHRHLSRDEQEVAQIT